ncbi:MAG: SH3 domain-containing protein, partial [Rickettsiales bacterium]|nr:SH3 domain-containing protein [Rickettsiales bacterium]
NPLPRFASLRSNEVTARVGPGTQYPVKYVYASKFQPVEVINEYYGWYQLKDVSGDISWVHRNYVSPTQYAVAILDGVLIYERAKPGSVIVAKVNRGVVFLPGRCEKGFCHVKTNVGGVEYKGYMLKDSLWGVQ